MANPQIEYGYTAIANDIAEALMKINLSAYESRVLWFVFARHMGGEKDRLDKPFSVFAVYWNRPPPGPQSNKRTVI
jgi:hypothetical protein